MNNNIKKKFKIKECVVKLERLDPKQLEHLFDRNNQGKKNKIKLKHSHGNINGITYNL